MTEKMVAVLLIVVAFVWFKIPSRYMEQFIVGERLSIVVKLKATVDEFEIDKLAGELRVTAGGVVSTVNVTLAEWIIPPVSFI